MADTKITALAAIGANPINVATFPIPMVDLLDNSMAASGTTKKVTVNQILGAGGTATLASATISGDLTVDTSTLKVDSANNRVGIGTASPSVPLHILNNTAATNTAVDVLLISQTSTGTPASGLGGGLLFRSQRPSGGLILNRGAIYGVSGADPDDDGDLAFYTLTNTGASGFTEKYRLDSNGVATWSNVGGVAGTAMTLNANGLGVGTSPTGKLTIGTGAYVAGTLSGTSSLYSTVGQGLVVLADGLVVGTRTGSDRFILDTSGNVGIGVVPSAWSNSGNIDLPNVFMGISSSGTYGGAIANNAYYNAGWKYKAANYANLYLTGAGEHKWLNAPVGAAAGDAITFTQAMTLDASGRLIINSSTFIPPTLNTNGELNFIATSNTNVRFSYRGTDGVTRVANITLA